MFDVLQLLDGHDHSVNFFACFNQLWFLLGRIGEEIITWGRHVFVCLLLVSIGKIVKGCAWRYGNPKQWMPYIQLAVGLFGRTAASILFTTSASRDGNHSTGGLRLWGETGHRKPVFDPTDDRHLVGYFSELFFFPQRYFCRMAENQMVQWKRLVGLSRLKDINFDGHMIAHAQFSYCYQLPNLYLYIYIHTI